MRSKNAKAIVFAVLAAVFYALNMPFSKILLEYVSPTVMAGFLYLGAGVGVGIMFLFGSKKTDKRTLLCKSDIPYTLAMIFLDILAPIFLMYGLAHTTSANASLLNNFEIVATTVIALMVFKEAVSKKLFLAVLFVTVSSAILSFEDISALKFSRGSVFVLLAAVCWGFENNCTRKISDKNTYEIVTVKGVCSGLGSLIIGLSIGETLPDTKLIAAVMLLGFVAYGLSIFFYIKAQNTLGAAKTSAYYSVAPFVGAFFSFLILKEPLTVQYSAALLFMVTGTTLATLDTFAIEK